MISFLTNKQAAEKIEGLEAANTQLEQDLAAAQTALQAAQTAESNLSEQVANLTAQLETITGERDAAQASLATAQETLSTVDERIEAGVLARFESLGGQPAPASNADQALTAQQIREKFEAMPAGPERSAFFKANKSILSPFSL